MRVGDLVTMDVAISKIPHVKQCCSSCSLWTLLVNQSSRECQLVKFKQVSDKIEQQFTKLLDVGGKQTFECFVISGEGEMTSSGPKTFNVNG